jgi:hypothetical protein
MPSPADAVTLKGYFDAADAARCAAERQWGCGRLELLASPDLLARFRRQQQTWRETLQRAWEMDPVSADALTLVSQKTQSMIRGWDALEAHAAEAGHRHVAPWVWEARLADGSIAAVVQTNAEVACVIAEGRYLKVFTLAEVAALIDATPDAFRPPPITEFRGVLAPSRRAYTEDIPFDDPIPFGAGVYA